MPNPFAELHIRHGNTWLQKGDLTSAIEEYSAAIKLVPTNSFYFNNRGVARYSNGEFDGAINDLTEAIRLDEKLIDPYFCRALAWQMKSNFDNAIDDFTQVINLTMNDDDAHFIPGTAHFIPGTYGSSKDGRWGFSIHSGGSSQISQLAYAFVARGGIWFDRGDFDVAFKDYSEAIGAQSNFALGYLSRGAACHAMGDFDNALKDYDEAIRLDPNMPQAYVNRGLMWHNRNDVDKALKDYDDGISLDSQNADAYNCLAWLRATHSEERYRHAQQAVECATKACDLSGWKVWNYLGTLAAAYAESSDFPNAIKWAEKSLELAPDVERQGAVQRLELYRSDKPYRDI